VGGAVVEAGVCDSEADAAVGAGDGDYFAGKLDAGYWF
jgi:hypothetical protein